MIIAIMAVYLTLLFAIVRLGIVRFNLFWKASPFIVLLLLNLGLFIPMGWGAPQGPVLVVRNAVSIVPNVAGEQACPDDAVVRARFRSRLRSRAVAIRG
jgi:hypothetical protein